MLVLTTMFINVSNSLPKTSYMKMVDAWLLFNLLYPFIVVLLHTYMDTLRNDGEREINHHGKSIKINDENNDNEDGGNVIQVWLLGNKKTEYIMLFPGQTFKSCFREWAGGVGGTERILQENRNGDGVCEIKKVRKN